MVPRLTGYHRPRSRRPANYIALGCRPDRRNRMAAAKTAYGRAGAASDLRALLREDGTVRADMEGVRAAPLRYAEAPHPVRPVGFPSYAAFLLEELRREGIRLRPRPLSRVMLGGGWKQFYRERVDKGAFYALVEETLGLPDRCRAAASSRRCGPAGGICRRPARSAASPSARRSGLTRITAGSAPAAANPTTASFRCGAMPGW